MEILMEQIMIWMPSLSAIAGIILSVFGVLKKVDKSINDFKESKLIKGLLEADEQLKIDNAAIKAENAELKKHITILVDQITKIQGYCEAKINEQNNN